MQNRTKIGHFPKQCDIIKSNIKERLDIHQEINNMTGFTVGGKSDESIEATIDAGANAITYTAYGMMEQYFHKKMETYRH